jgi:hypothetical protein
MQDKPCKDHPDAPHGFMRDASHSAGRYVCECESWEPKQEPVAWMFVNEDGECEQIEYGPVFDDPGVTPLYAAPPKREWIGLTDEEIQDLGYLSEKFDASNSEWFDRWGFAQAIEAKLKEKNKWIEKLLKKR